MALKGSNDTCMQNTADDEPVFTLCARDITAPYVVRTWVSKVRSAYQELASAVPQEVTSKLQEALECAEQMERWQRKHGCKIPD